MDEDQNIENEPYDRVEDVMRGMNSYGAMIAMFFHLSEQNPVIPLMAAEFMAQLIHKLHQWGVVDDQQQEQLMFRIREDAATRKAQIMDHLNKDSDDPERDPTKDLIASLGI